MFCKSCGKEIADDSKICAYCGVQVAAPAAAPVAAAPAEENLGFNIFGLIGMILGILSIVFCWVEAGIVGLVFAIPGLVLSIIGSNKVDKSKGMAKAGKITSILGLVFSLVIFTIFFIIIGIIVGAAGAGGLL